MRPPAAEAALPELLEAATELAGAQGDDGVGPGDAPVHAGTFAPCSDHHLAAGLNDSGRGTEPGSPEHWVAHASAVALDVVDALARFVILRRVPP